MTSTKPRIIKRYGMWIVTKSWLRLSNGIVAVMPLGQGKTPQQAWDNAFPKPWWRRIWS